MLRVIRELLGVAAVSLGFWGVLLVAFLIKHPA